MAAQLFTLRYDDQSDEKGYRFIFKCGICNLGYSTRYLEAESSKISGYISTGTKIFDLAEDVMRVVPLPDKPDLKDIDSSQRELAKILAKKYEGMSPEWHRGHDKALELAREEVVDILHNCSVCKRWVCESDWNEVKVVCKEDSKLKICPKCRFSNLSGKFCTSCGEPLELFCPKCQAICAIEMKFCGECGQPLRSSKRRIKKSKRKRQ